MEVTGQGASPGTRPGAAGETGLVFLLRTASPEGARGGTEERLTPQGRERVWTSGEARVQGQGQVQGRAVVPLRYFVDGGTRLSARMDMVLCGWRDTGPCARVCAEWGRRWSIRTGTGGAGAPGGLPASGGRADPRLSGSLWTSRSWMQLRAGRGPAHRLPAAPSQCSGPRRGRRG